MQQNFMKNSQAVSEELKYKHRDKRLYTYILVVNKQSYVCSIWFPNKMSYEGQKASRCAPCKVNFTVKSYNKS